MVKQLLHDWLYRLPSSTSLNDHGSVSWRVVVRCAPHHGQLDLSIGLHSHVAEAPYVSLSTSDGRIRHAGSLVGKL